MCGPQHNSGRMLKCNNAVHISDREEVGGGGGGGEGVPFVVLLINHSDYNEGTETEEMSETF